MFQIKWILDNMGRERRLYIVCLLSTVLLAIMTLINPILSQRIVDEVVLQLPNYAQDISPLLPRLYQLIAMMIGFTLLRSTMQYFSILGYERSGQKFLYHIKNDLYRNLQSQDMTFYSENRTGDLMTRLTGDMDMVRHTISWISRQLIDCFCLFGATTVYMFSQDVWFTVAMLAVTPFIFLAARRFSKQVRPLYVQLREKLSLLNTNAQENIAGNRVIKAFAREPYEMDKFDQKNAEYREANLTASMKWLSYFPYIEGFSQAMSLAVLLVGGIFMMNGRISGGTFLAFNSLTWTLSNPMRMLGMLLNDLQRFFASCDKVIELYYTKPHIRNRKAAKTTTKPMQGSICFNDVTVRLHHTEVLSHINLEIQPGETLAIMGSTGSGKTTLINCIGRFVDITSGSLKLDGIEVKDYDLHTLRRNIGMANQDVFLFSDTIDSNIAYGDLSLSEEEVQEFAKLADAGFVESTADGYETLVGERGTGLSGGQKQRLALARALAVKPAILILDDTTSAVDLETEKQIQENLRNLQTPCTKIIIAQRVSTTQSADHIAVMDRGQIIEYGTHEELLAQNGYYREVYDLQNGTETDRSAQSGKEATANGTQSI